MRDPRIPQHAQQIGRGIGLYRIERLARKLLDKEAGSAHRGVRAIEDNGFVRRKRVDYSPCIYKNVIRMDVQLKGPPKRFVETMKRQAALRLGRDRKSTRLNSSH